MYFLIKHFIFVGGIKHAFCSRWSHKQCEKLTEEHCDLIKQMLTKSQLVQPPKSGGDAASAEVRDASGTAADVKNIRFNFLCSDCTAEQNETYEGGSNSSWMAKVQFYLKVRPKITCVIFERFFAIDIFALSPSCLIDC